MAWHSIGEYACEFSPKALIVVAIILLSIFAHSGSVNSHSVAAAIVAAVVIAGLYVARTRSISKKAADRMKK